MTAHPADPAYALVPLSQVAREFGRTRRTLTRWLNEPGFPPVFKIHAKNYVERAALEAWKAKQRSRTLAPVFPANATAEHV